MATLLMHSPVSRESSIHSQASGYSSRAPSESRRARPPHRPSESFPATPRSTHPQAKPHSGQTALKPNRTQTDCASCLHVQCEQRKDCAAQYLLMQGAPLLHGATLISDAATIANADWIFRAEVEEPLEQAEQAPFEQAPGARATPALQLSWSQFLERFCPGHQSSRLIARTRGKVTKALQRSRKGEPPAAKRARPLRQSHAQSKTL